MSKRRRYWKNADRLLSGSVASLIVFGLVAVSSASAVLSYQRFGHTNYYLFRQLLFAAIGFILIYVFSKIDFHVWRKWNKPIILGAIVVLAAVLIPGIGFSSGGSRSWFSLGPFLIQPSEFAKLALIFYLASWFLVYCSG